MSRRTSGGFDPEVRRSDLFGGVIPGSRHSTIPGDQVLLRGEAAARAERIDLVARTGSATLGAVGPWAEQLDDAREQARSAGFEEGRQAGLEHARQEVERHQAELAAAIETMLEQLEVRSNDLGRQLAEQTAALALEVARAVLDREVAATDDPGAEAIARCLDLVPAVGCLVARLNPQDAAHLGDVPGLGDRELVVAADPALSPGDAIVSVDQITVDARLSESLRRVGEALQ